MTYWLLPLILLLSSCSQSAVEEEEEPDYDEMVMLDEEELIDDAERDRKMVVETLPDPKELIIIEPFHER